MKDGDEPSDASTSSGASSDLGTGDSSPEFPQTESCSLLLDCIAESSPDLLNRARAAYGVGGHCWSGTAERARSCDSTCAELSSQMCSARPEGSDTGSTEPTPEPPPVCSAEALAPEEQSWVRAGRGEGLLPPSIGTIIDDYCGCHVVPSESLSSETPGYFGEFAMSTWNDFHAPFRGRPAYLLVQERVRGLSMPPVYHCGSGPFGSFTEGDFLHFDAWLEAGAPDAPNFDG